MNGQQMTPWAGMPEWRYVAERLFSEDLNDMNEAMRIAKIWLIRGNCPTAVESTINILQIINDIQSAKILPQLARHSLASVLIRFVNEVVDPMQQGTYALPISHLAEKQNVPRLLVDIRHAATHHNMPSLQTLCFGAQLAINWLRQYYWDPTFLFDPNIQHASLQAITRFEDELPYCHPLNKPINKLAFSCLEEVGGLFDTEETQLYFLTILFEHHIKEANVAHLIEVLATKDPSFILVVMGWSKKLSKTKFYGSRFQSILTVACRRSIDAELFGRCVKMGYELVGHRGRDLLQILMKEAKIQSISPELKELVDILLTGQSTNIVKDPITLINRGKRFISTRASAVSKEDPSWHPIPLGCAPHFNPIDAFVEMHKIRDDIKVEWIHSSLKLPNM